MTGLTINNNSMAACASPYAIRRDVRWLNAVVASPPLVDADQTGYFLAPCIPTYPCDGLAKEWMGARYLSMGRVCIAMVFVRVHPAH